MGRAARRRSGARDAVAVALAVVAFGRAGFSQTQRELATRRYLIEQATAERAAGRHAQALVLAQRAGAVLMTPSVQLFIAQEMDATGDPAGALGLADQCVRDLGRDPTVARRAALLQTCRDLAREARARVGYLVVDVPSPAPDGLGVTVQGAALAPALLGVPNVVSPGSVVVEASAPGRQPFAATRGVAIGATVHVEVALAPVAAPVAEPVAEPPRAVAPPLAVSPVVAPTPRPRRSNPSGGSRVLPWTLVAGGGAALVGGAVLWAVRSAALEGCVVADGAASCDTPAHLDAAMGANRLAAGAGVLLGVGVVAVGAGLGWRLLSRSVATPSPGATLDVGLTRGALTVGLRGRFP
jgi:hypothetical protein